MLIHAGLLLLSAGYSVWYGVFCIRRGRGGAGAGAFLLALPALFLFVTLVCIS